MGFWEWMGVENPRDSPKTEQPKEGLPQVTDNVRDSGQTFVFGRSNAGEQVDEKAAMQIPTVYACVRLLAESIAALPLHLYRVTDDNGNKEKARDHPLYKILYRQPNPEMTSFVFWETLMTHLLLWGNAYAQIVRDGKNTVRKPGKEEPVMALIPLYEAKTYLRVDSSDEDALIGILLSSAEQMCKDVGRLSEDQWEAVNAADRDAENGVEPTRELEALRSTCRVAILYALGYLYEHRDEADHKQLMLTLRSILFAVREGVF